jgi:protein SCO1/2
MRRKLNRESWVASAAFVVLLAAAGFGLAACKSSAPVAHEKRYHLAGKVVSVDLDHNIMTVDMQAVPGYMEAMTMPFTVPDARNLATVKPDDEIVADIVVTGDTSHIENIIVTKRGGPSPAPPATQRVPRPGESVPNFAMVNQQGQRIHLDSFRGSVLLVTFIYTRCPFPDYCPLVSKNFAQIYAATRNDPVLRERIRLLSVSFDPARDTPAVLMRYARTFRQTTGGDPFDRWEFAVVSAKDLPKIADFFGFFTSSSAGQIVHSMSTTVISPQGKVYKWYEDNAWAPDDLLADATAALRLNDLRTTTTAQARTDTLKSTATSRVN